MRKIGTIKIELSDWLYNAGIVGLVKILELSRDNYLMRGNSLEIEENVLENFEKKYFDYFMDKYETFTSWFRIVSYEDELQNIKETGVNDANFKKLNDQIKYTKDRLKSNSYTSGYVIINNHNIDLLKESKNLKTIKKNKKQSLEDLADEIYKQIDNMLQIIAYLNKDEFKRVIMSKNIIYDIIAKFWSNVSFLHKNENKKDMNESLKKYFLDAIVDYLEQENKEKYKYKCFNCNAPISKLSKPAAFDLTWLNKIGVDMSRKASHFWNFNADTFICPICNLVYACIPAGFTVIRNSGIFINENMSLENLIKVNNTTIDNNTSFEELEEASYYRIADSIKQSEVERSDKEIDNIQIIKFDNNNESRPYTFNVLSKKRLNIIVRHKKRLRGLVRATVKTNSNEYINLYREVIERLYNNKSQFDIIYNLLNLSVDGKFKRLGYIDTILKINNDFIGGIMGNQGVYYKDIDKIQQLGYELRESYKNKKAENKISGISYRLLNSLKTKNQNKFMDTMINAYMYSGKQIPVILLDSLKGDNKLQSVGYAFVLGLQGETGKYYSNKGDKNE